MKIIKHLFTALFIALTIGIVSCKKDDGPTTNTEDLYKNKPSTPIPASLKNGLWFWGGLSPISYYDRDGHQVGNDWEAARQYSFTEVDGKGRLEFIQYLGTRNASNCVTEIYTLKKGTVVFEGTDKFTFHPVEGNFRTVKKGCSNDGTTKRQATAEELKPEDYLWEIKQISGEPYFYIYDSKDVNKEDPVFVYSFAQ
ncbi:hypothetical protein D3C80_325350 [compost metagenome]